MPEGYLIEPEAASEEPVQDQERRNRIRAALDRVDVRTREIYLAHRAGYSYAEISEYLNISYSAIKRHIAQALLAILEHGEL
jgi:RNA polymerase sigma factor (sigma-70 family)